MHSFLCAKAKTEIADYFGILGRWKSADEKLDNYEIAVDGVDHSQGKKF